MHVSDVKHTNDLDPIEAESTSERDGTIIPLGAVAKSGHYDLTPELQSALALAEALSSGSAEHPRVVLVKRLSDLLLLPPEQVTPPERALLDEILVRMIDYVDCELRKRVAGRISRMAEPPAELLLRLSRDDISVAETILTESTEIPESDLIETVRHSSFDHRRAVAERKVVSSALAVALLEKGEPLIIEKLLRNDKASLSLSAMQTIAEMSRTRPKLQELLLQRHDLHPSLAQAMFWWVSPKLRTKILHRFAVSRRVLQQAIMDAVKDGEFDLDSNDEVEKEALEFVQGVWPQHRPQASEILEHLKAGRTEEFLSSLSQSAGITRAILMKILKDESGEALAVLCKAVNMPKSDFELLQRWLFTAQSADAASDEKSDRVTAVFDSLPNDAADLFLRYWNKPRVGLRSQAESTESPID